MIRVLGGLLLFASAIRAQPNYPYHVLSMKGAAVLKRFGENSWPLEVGEDLPGDFRLQLKSGAFILFRVDRRMEVAAAGPADFRSIIVERSQDTLEQKDLSLKIVRGQYLFDTRFLLGHPSQIHLDLPQEDYELEGASLTALSVDESGVAGAKVDNPDLMSLLTAPVPVLVLVRDYDKKLKAWPHPAILGPALIQALRPLTRLRLCPGSGSRKLAAYANHALKTGEDFFLQSLARKRGARFLIMGNMVSEVRHAANLRHTPLIVASVELRVLETAPRGEEVINEMATKIIPRRRRSLEIVDALAMRGAAKKVAGYLVDDMKGLLRGQAHPPVLVRVIFRGLRPSMAPELRRALAELSCVQRFFKRNYAQNVFNVDLILRNPTEVMVRDLEACRFKNFSIQRLKSSTDEVIFGVKPRSEAGRRRGTRSER